MVGTGERLMIYIIVTEVFNTIVNNTVTAMVNTTAVTTTVLYHPNLGQC